MQIMKQAEKLINWSELSRIIVTGGDRSNIKSGHIPPKHAKKVNRLLIFIENWINKK